MKMYEYLVSIIAGIVESIRGGESARRWFDTLEKAQKHLPYNAQLDVHESGSDGLVFIASVPHNERVLPCVIVVKPTFAGLDITVVGIKNVAITQHVATEFSQALEEEVMLDGA